MEKDIELHFTRRELSEIISFLDDYAMMCRKIRGENPDNSTYSRVTLWTDRLDTIIRYTYPH